MFLKKNDSSSLIVLTTGKVAPKVMYMPQYFSEKLSRNSLFRTVITWIGNKIPLKDGHGEKTLFLCEQNGKVWSPYKNKPAFLFLNADKT